METPPVNPAPAPAPLPEEPKKNNTALIIGIIAVVLLCCCCLAAVGIYLYQNGDRIFGTGYLPLLLQALA
jgi:hypothetical protein